METVNIPENLIYHQAQLNITKIGIAPLITAIGVQENYSITKQKEDTTKKVYINEKNQFGSRKELHKSAILLYIYLHFLMPDKYGHIRMGIKETATIINCSEKTIKRNLKVLHARDYIAISPGLFPHTYEVFIKGFNELSKPAAKSGRGYMQLSWELFCNLLDSKTVNDVRLKLRGLTSNVNGMQKDVLSNEKSFKEIKRLLPQYTTFNDIKAALLNPSFMQIFDVKFSAEGSYFKINLKDIYNIKLKLDEQKTNCQTELEAVLNIINNEAKLTHSDKRMITKLPKWTLSEKDKQDIINISLQYPITIIMDAVKQVYKQYIVNKQPVQKLGALVRTLTNEFYNYQSKGLTYIV